MAAVYPAKHYIPRLPFSPRYQVLASEMSEEMAGYLMGAQ